MDPPIAKDEIPQEDIEIRAAEPSDIPDLTEAWNQPQAYAGTLQLPFTSVGARQARFAAASGATRLVAVVGGKAIGMIFLTREANRRIHVGAIGMAVHDAYAGRGVGSALMAAVVDLADNWLQLKRLELSVFADNARAISLYERFGFEREGLCRAYAWRGGDYVDALSMARLRL
jgi:putative acetyltransferase